MEHYPVTSKFSSYRYNGGAFMPKAMTKTQLIAKIAEKAAITKKAAGEIMGFIAETAY